MKGSTHYPGDEQDFDVSSEGPSSAISRGYRYIPLLIPEEGHSLEMSKSCLSFKYSESILYYICRLLSATHTGNGLK